MAIRSIAALLVFPGGVVLMLAGLMYYWLDRKVIARLQDRMGPRWFQSLADTLKLLVKEEVVPDGVHPLVFNGLPVVALAGALTAALYVPLFGLAPAASYPGDLIITIYMLSLLTLCIGLAGAYVRNQFSLVGAIRALTQMFAYEAPFMLALLGPAIVAGSWQISEILAHANGRFLILTQPVGFIIALIGLMGKLEMPPFDAPEAETEIVAGALTEYSGRGLALFKLGQAVELVIGLTLITAFYLGSVANPLLFFVKTIGVLLLLATLQSLMTRLRIDQTVGLWWRYGSLLALAQFLVLIGLKLMGVAI